MTIFATHRRRLLTAHPNELFVLTAYDQMQLSGDMAAPFLQEASFFYLTGITEPGWRVVVDGKQKKSWLIAPHVTDHHALFDGGLSFAEARRISGIKDIVPFAEALQFFTTLSSHHHTVHTLGKDPYAKYYDFTMNPAQRQLTRSLKAHFSEIVDARSMLAKLRAIKQPHEIEAIEAAVDITIASFKKVHKQLKKASHEYELEATFSYEFRHHGHQGHAYDPIIAGGAHACTLHYGKNNDALPKNGLVLLDVGARVGGYAADITRTYAVGKPSQREKDVHAAVQRAHAKIIALLRPGLMVKEYHEQVDEIMKAELDGLGLLKHPDDYRKYFPHAISHGLGIDVHDSLGGPDVFMAGMVLTVEPGIYIPDEGIGVRIEDDILITTDGHRNLSADLPTGL